MQHPREEGHLKQGEEIYGIQSPRKARGPSGLGREKQSQSFALELRG